MLREDLAVIEKVCESAKRGLPIASKPGKLGLAALSFYTDAAGASFSMQNGEKDSTITVEKEWPV